MKKVMLATLLSMGMLVSASASAVISDVKFEIYKTSDTKEPVLVNSIDTVLYTSGLGGYLNVVNSSHTFEIDKKPYTSGYYLKSKLSYVPNSTDNSFIYSFSYEQNTVNAEDLKDIDVQSFSTEQNVRFTMNEVNEISIPPYLLKIKATPITQNSEKVVESDNLEKDTITTDKK